MKAKIENIIVTTLKNLADEFEMKELQSPNATTQIYGGGGGLDSLALVSFITDLEQTLNDELGLELILADERAMSSKNSPFKNVGSLTQYILTLCSKD